MYGIPSDSDLLRVLRIFYTYEYEDLLKVKQNWGGESEEGWLKAEFLAFFFTVPGQHTGAYPGWFKQLLSLGVA